MKTLIPQRVWIWPMLCLLGQLETSALAQGLPEPGLIMFGKITDLEGHSSIRLGYGTLSWVLQPVDGSPAITVSTTLTNLNNEFSYALTIPCETPVFGKLSTPNTIQLRPRGFTINRSYVTWNGTNLLSFVQPALTNTVFSSTDRGRIEQVDFQLVAPMTIDPYNGLPVDWELSYFGRTGIDPNADPDQDGVSNFAEYLAGTDPTDAHSKLWITDILPAQGGIQVKWLSADSRRYVLQRSTSLSGGFLDVVSPISATPPLNSFVDSTATGQGPYFYRIRLNP